MLYLCTIGVINVNTFALSNSSLSRIDSSQRTKVKEASAKPGREQGRVLYPAGRYRRLLSTRESG